MSKKENMMGDMAVAQSLESSVEQEPQPVTRAEDVISKRVGREQVLDAMQTLQKYKSGKDNLEQRIVENQQWYKLRQWECMRRKARETDKRQVEPTSAWLFNNLANKHADAMDNFPTVNVLPREASDAEEAKMLSSILPVILDQNNFEQVYSDVTDDKLQGGTGIYAVLWDPGKHNGLGDVSIKNVEVLNLFWEPGIQDIQESRNVFYVYLRDNDLLEQAYPQLSGKLGGEALSITKYLYDDTVDTSGKSAVVDWYYKTIQNGRQVLHYCQFIAGQTEPLFASENDEQYREEGWYHDGQYPFVFDPLYKTKGTPCGFGYIDIAKSVQEYIDRGGQAILENLFVNTRPRHFVRADGTVNEEEYADMTKDLVHVEGGVGEDSIRPIQGTGLSGIYVTILRDKIDELKETTGNRDVSTGGTTSGVTAASAISAMMEAGSKIPRDSNKASFRAFRLMILMVIERVRQFYDAARSYRITGENGEQEFVQFDNSGLKPQPQGSLVNGQPQELGVDVGHRIPLFDLTVSAEKNSAYSRMSQNELALQFYSAGFFVPQNAPAALACLEMMDFDRKDSVLRLVRNNGSLQQQLMATQKLALNMAQQLDPSGQMYQQMAAQFAGGGMPDPGNPAPGGAAAQRQEALGGEHTRESSITKNARERVAESTAP